MLYQLSARYLPIALWETDRAHVDDVAFSPDGRWIAAHPYLEALTSVGHPERRVCIAEMAFTKKSDRFGLTKPVFSQDGERLVVFNGPEYNRKVQAWCPRTGALLSETQIQSTYNDVYPTCFSPDLKTAGGDEL